MTLRLACIVPGCKHTRGQRKGETPIEEGEEWVCGDHWRAVPSYLRRRKARFARLYRKRFGDDPFWQFPAGSPKRIEAVRIKNLRARSWEQCKREAIERGLGIK